MYLWMRTWRLHLDYVVKLEDEAIQIGEVAVDLHWYFAKHKKTDTI